MPCPCSYLLLSTVTYSCYSSSCLAPLGSGTGLGSTILAWRDTVILWRRLKALVVKRRFVATVVRWTNKFSSLCLSPLTCKARKHSERTTVPNSVQVHCNCAVLTGRGAHRSHASTWVPRRKDHDWLFNGVRQTRRAYHTDFVKFSLARALSQRRMFDVQIFFYSSMFV